MAINSSKGIKIGIPGGELSEKAYGGYAFNANYSINFTQPSKMTVSFVSKDGTYDESALAARIFPGQNTNYGPSSKAENFVHQSSGGESIQDVAVKYDVPLDALLYLNKEEGESVAEALERLSALYKDQAIDIPTSNKVTAVSSNSGGAISYDIIEFAGQTFKMHPLKYSIAEGPDGRYLQIDYYDQSIKYLDKAIVILNQKHDPPIYDPTYPPFAGGFASNRANIISLGQAYVNAKDRQSGAPGVPQAGGQATKVVPTYLYSPIELYQGILACPWLNGMVDAASCQILSQYPFIYGGANGNDRFLKDHVGTLREVLNAWAQDLGFIFYWEPVTDQLKIMDLRSDLSFNKIQNTVQQVVDARNITQRNWSYSIEDTFSKGVAAYWARDGIAEGDSSTESFYMLDLLGLNIHKCYADESKSESCGDTSATIWNFVNYCDDKKWASKEMSNVRSKKSDLIDYIRLLKAAAIGPDFYKIYVLNKKAFNTTLDGAASKDKYTDWGSHHPPISLYSSKVIDSEEVANQHSGLASPDKISFWNTNAQKLSGFGTDLSVSPNELVSELYKSTGNEQFNKAKLCKEDEYVTDSWIDGDDCISIELIGERSQAQVDQIYRLSAARLINAGAKSSSSLSSSSGEEDSGRPYYFYRMKKYGISAFLNNTSEDHIFKLLNGIAKNQGRFYYSRTLQSSAKFSEKSYDAKGVNWYDRALDVGDTVFGELYYSVDPEASLASNPMPNDCIDGKNRESKQVKKDGSPFENPENTARPTVEQFIQSVYGDTITDKADGAAANLNVNVAGGAVTTISVAGGGENYLNGGDGSLTVTIIGKGGGASAEATIEDGQVTSVSVTAGGSGYEDDTTATVAGGTSSGKDTNVFGDIETQYGYEAFDSILATNLAQLTEENRKNCDETDDRMGVVVVDVGSSMKIPNLIQQRVERHVQAFSVIPTTTNLSIVKYFDEAGYQVLALAKLEDIESIREDNEAWFAAKDKEGTAPKDELDFIVDQVEIPQLDASFGDGAKDQISLTSNFTFAGDYFETKATIRPLHESNVREVNMEFLTPSERDLGVLEGDCIEDPDEEVKKRKRDDKLIQSNIAAYANAFAYQQQRVEYNAQVSIVDDQIRKANGHIIDLTVEKGLESVSARIGDDGTKLTYSVGTRRKRRVINKPFEDLWLRVKPEFYNNIFDV